MDGHYCDVKYLASVRRQLTHVADSELVIGRLERWGVVSVDPASIVIETYN